MKRDMKNWIYITDSDNTARYALGIEGANPLVCIGVNPSTASPENLDATIHSVRNIAGAKGYEGWIMLNLYPQRSTKPDDVALEKEKGLYDTNIEVIRTILYKYKPTLWAAWGTFISKRLFFYDTLEEIYVISKSTRCPIVNYGPLTNEGHPRHPLYQGVQKEFQQFNLNGYLTRNNGYHDTSENFTSKIY